MSKNAILVVSFGTTKDETRKKNIEAVENEVAAAFPDWTVRRAFTSSIVMRRLEERGIHVDNVPQAMERLQEEGFTQVIILPTHLLPGEEYHKLLDFLAPFAASFQKLAVAKPLLYGTEDVEEVSAFLKEAYPLQEKEAMLLMGHGTGHFANHIYPAMAYILNEMGAGNIFVATVEGYPQFEPVLERIRKEGYQKVKLVPLMLVAGEHAMNDMAGDEEDSWRSQCAAAGLEVSHVLAGLGESRQVRRIYLRHLRECMEG